METGKDTATIEVIARGIILDRSKKKILLCTPKNGEYCYFPGGHIEWSESAPEALRRELAEETGIQTDPAKYSFAGADENIFFQDGRKKHEINLYFKVNEEFSEEDIVSQETEIAFRWISKEKSDSIAILPNSARIFFQNDNESPRYLGQEQNLGER